MANETASDDRLTQINQELSSILEAKLEFLTRTLSDTQRTTQKIATTPSHEVKCTFDSG